MTKAVLLSLGSVNLDFQVRVDRWPGPSETLLGSEFLVDGGGKAANRALLARRLGAEVQLIARVGDDQFLADRALRSLRAAGVQLDAVRAVRGQATGVAMIAVRPDGDKTIILAGNANDAWNPDATDEVSQLIRAAPRNSFLAADLEASPSVVRAALQAARQSGHAIVLDPSPSDRLEDQMYRYIDYITPDAGEADRLTGVKVEGPNDGFRAADALRERGVGAAIVKLSGGGCVVVSEDLREHLPAVAVKPVDTTGAGDAFAGALCVALLEGRPPRDAARFAVSAAAFAVTRYGSQKAYPERDEFDRFLQHETTVDGE